VTQRPMRPNPLIPILMVMPLLLGGQGSLPGKPTGSHGPTPPSNKPRADGGEVFVPPPEAASQSFFYWNRAREQAWR
jgi:hypothetical protein